MNRMGAYKLNIGDGQHFLKWDGAILSVKGLIGDITLKSVGFVRTDGKDNYADPTAGFFLGYDGGAYKLNIGNAAKYLKWTGSALQVKGLVSLDALSVLNANIGNITAGNIRGVRFQVGGGTNEDIYFEDSGIRFYDASGVGLVFAKVGLKSAFLLLGSSAIAFGGIGIPRIEFYDDNKIILNAVTKAFTFYGSGEIQYPLLTSAPTGAKGRFVYNSANDRPVFKNVSEWRHWTGLSGW